jgi:hypothetical protein
MCILNIITEVSKNEVKSKVNCAVKRNLLIKIEKMKEI